MNFRKLQVTGAGPNISELDKFLSSAVGIPAENVDSLRYARKLPKKLSPLDPSYRGVSLTAIVGIGLAPAGLEFNLTPDSVKLRKGLEKKAKALTLFGMLVMTVIVFFSMSGILKLCLKRNCLSSVKSELQKTQAQVREVEGKQAIVEVVRGHQDPKFAMVSLLSEIHSKTPDGVLFDTVDIDLDGEKDQVRLAGSGAARTDVSTLVKNLEQSVLFKNAREEGATAKDKDTGRFNFKAICALEKDK